MRVVLVSAIALLAVLYVATRTFAQACTDGSGPSLSLPSPSDTGIGGLHAALVYQSGNLTLCPGHKGTVTLGYLNTGSWGWYGNAYLGTWGPNPGQDQVSNLGPLGANWIRPNRPAVQTTPYVGPGQIGWFTFSVVAPSTPGDYRLYLRPVIEGVTWLEDYGVWLNVHVPGRDVVPAACASDFCYPRLGLVREVVPYDDCLASTDIGEATRLLTCLNPFYLAGHAYTPFGLIANWQVGDVVWLYQKAYVVTGAYTQPSCTPLKGSQAPLSLQTSLTSASCGDVLVVQASLR